ncbi:MAG TPA: cytochrome c [Actinobacteria bacterium]|nr:cytochrome c [Actinomycetota bacterium]
MTEQLSTVAAAMGTPEELVERAARARATAQGNSYEEIIAAWAGETPAPTATIEAKPLASEVTLDEAVEPAPETPPASTGATAPVEATTVDAVADAVAAPPTPQTVSRREAAQYSEVTTVSTVGIKERTRSTTPGWLSGVFVILPIAAIIYFISFPSGPNCGVGGQLSVDRQTGSAVNCDGTEYQAGGPIGGVDAREIVASGSLIYSQSCASCHGVNGGGGTGPQLAGGAVTAVFAGCGTQLEWVGLGSTGFQNAGRTTYGDSDKPVNGGMPGFGTTLSPDDLLAVVYFERVNFGGQDATEALIDCGFLTEDEQDAPAEEEVEAMG